MKIGLSNLAFPAKTFGSQLDRLASLGLSGVEVAPTRIAPWQELTDECLLGYRAGLESKGLSIPSLQAIFFGVDGIGLLGDSASFSRMTDHMHRLGHIGQTLGASVAVFGAPRQRLRGTLSDDEAFELGAERLSTLGHVVAQYGLTIGLEPVPPVYGCDFLTTWQDVRDMTETIGTAGIRVHLDTSCVQLGGGVIDEAIAACGRNTVHFHAAEPQLKDFLHPEASHTAAAAALQAIGYDGWVVIEMLEDKAGGDDPVSTAANYVVKTYLPSKD